MANTSKTEKATPKKRRDEQKKGNIFQSRDAVSAFSILAIFTVLRIVFPYGWRLLSQDVNRYFSYGQTLDALTVSLAAQLLRDAMLGLLMLAGPVMLTSVLAGVALTGAQTRFRFAGEKIKFKLSNLSPLRGFKRMFSLRSVTELLKTLVKIILIGAVLWSSIAKLFGRIMELMYGDIMQGTGFILTTIMDMVIRLSLVFAAIAAADYFYQWWEYEREMRMTKQEVKEEFRQQEGDPLVKSQIRERQRKISMSRMMQQVPDADVVVRNPTHYAVALKYDADKSTAPVVLAKGRDYTALRIVELAKKHDIPTTENKPLAQALYRAVEIGREIPEEFYTVMAEILAWVYSLKKETRRH